MNFEQRDPSFLRVTNTVCNAATFVMLTKEASLFIAQQLTQLRLLPSIKTQGRLFLGVTRQRDKAVVLVMLRNEASLYNTTAI